MEPNDDHDYLGIVMLMFSEILRTHLLVVRSNLSVQLLT